MAPESASSSYPKPRLENRIPEAAASTGLIFDLKRFSVHDGPGIRTTVFLKGCPFECPWCHNPESRSPQTRLHFRVELCAHCGACVPVCPEQAVSLGESISHTDLSRCRERGACAEACPSGAREMLGRRITIDDLLQEIVRDTPFFDESEGGVTFSGGEPLHQAAFLAAALAACGELEIHRAVDTSGHAEVEILRAVAAHTDLFLYDLKFADEERHREFTGHSNRLVLSNLRLLAELAVPVEIRVPVIPGITDDADNLEAIGSLAAELGNVTGLCLLPFHAAAMDKYRRFGMPLLLPAMEPPVPEDLRAMAARLSVQGLHVTIGGEKDE